ncbi:hypothetical protein DND132_1055 [Pseudodesulfovibrio mercurii]|uniref:Uncharacterized protein n=2 Tax=Pseudodesulfovibrio mercurii TaxID=641491 RepID=F0JBE9_9BACT|nr:hypothetical protein DND132_1055 [Pseudodesulfovibrio mercurii]
MKGLDDKPLTGTTPEPLEPLALMAPPDVPARDDAPC